MMCVESCAWKNMSELMPKKVVFSFAKGCTLWVRNNWASIIYFTAGVLCPINLLRSRLRAAVKIPAIIALQGLRWRAANI